MLLDADVRLYAVKHKTGRNLRKFLRLHLVQPSSVDAAFGKKLVRRNSVQDFPHAASGVSVSIASVSDPLAAQLQSTARIVF